MLQKGRSKMYYALQKTRAVGRTRSSVHTTESVEHSISNHKHCLPHTIAIWHVRAGAGVPRCLYIYKLEVTACNAQNLPP